MVVEKSTWMTEKTTEPDLFDFVEALPSLAEEKEIRDIIKKNPDFLDEPIEDTSEKLDIFVEMANADLRNLNFYRNLKPKLQKQFSPLVAMKWFSTVADSSNQRDKILEAVNTRLNTNFWALRDHPELQWMLMASCGRGVKQRHQWINIPKRIKISKVDEFMLQWYPDANNLELKLLTQRLTRDEFEQFAKSAESDDKKLKDVLDAFDEERGIKPKKASKPKARK